MLDKCELTRLRELIAKADRVPPPREIDIDLFHFIDGRSVHRVVPSRGLTLASGGNLVEGRWTYVPDDEATLLDDTTDHSSLIPRSDVPRAEVPYYTSQFDSALGLKQKLLPEDRTLTISEERGPYLTFWDVKLHDSTGRLIAEGRSHECASAIVICVLGALIEASGVT
jgi:hypothetical protein